MSEMEIDENSMEAPQKKPGEESAVVEYRKSISAMGRDELIQFIDSMDNRVEELRKEAIKLQDQRDHLLTRIDLLKTTDLLTNLNESDQDEIKLHLKRINDRLQTVDISVKTLRDNSQVDSLHVINHLIDEVIRSDDPIVKRQKCQEYLAACSSDFHYYMTISATGPQTFVDKKFEVHLLGCALDDQKRIKKRLEALMNYMAQQIISE